ncbi:UvrD-helicase domain-containing protein [Actinoallomurus sp. NBC_01490]|uniref:UvrD-helicase domain-containing protein n=1 Tax=Actinoallomurus sp. NBC_01490 TaxID=2903557 RepID=UPI002E2F0A22|nr:UvrD-helicase domain-containing protein [Actinoallomurus sp. NBC_01490]
MTTPLTDTQLALATSPVSTFAMACPGAGKTRAIVERFLRRTQEEPRKGVALVSFTNTAIEEIKIRCADRTDAVRAPNFLGTFDGFLHRFIVTPLFPHVYGIHPRYVQSWDDLRSAKFTTGHTGYQLPIKLSWFDYAHDGKAHLKIDEIPPPITDEFKKLLALHRDEIEKRAGQTYLRFLRAGTVTCDAARVLTSRFLTSRKGPDTLRRLVGVRFAEIIVDEAQDCGEEELAALEFLRQCGVTIVMVGDLDQSIFEFRRALPDKVAAYGASLPSTVAMTENFRSSPAVCSFNNALRSGPMTESAAGAHASVTTPVILISYTQPSTIAAQVITLGQRYGIAAADLVILAHREKDGLKAVGKTAFTLSSNRVLAIADAGRQLRSQTFDAKSRQAAIIKVEKLIVDSVLGIDPGHRTHDRVCEEEGIDPRWLRDLAVRIATRLDPAGMTAAAYAKAVRACLASTDWGCRTPQANLGNIIKAPSAADWAKLISAGQHDGLATSTVHRAKGREYRGVALVLPQMKSGQRTVLDDWELGTDSEARRVLYTAGSRAQELLIVAAPQRHADRVAKLFVRDSIIHAIDR